LRRGVEGRTPLARLEQWPGCRISIPARKERARGAREREGPKKVEKKPKTGGLAKPTTGGKGEREETNNAGNVSGDQDVSGQI